MLPLFQVSVNYQRIEGEKFDDDNEEAFNADIPLESQVGGGENQKELLRQSGLLFQSLSSFLLLLFAGNRSIFGKTSTVPENPDTSIVLSQGLSGTSTTRLITTLTTLHQRLSLATNSM